MMKTKNQIENLWLAAKAYVDANPLAIDTVHLRRLDTENKFPTYAGVDADGRQLMGIGSSKHPFRIEVKSNAFDYYITERHDRSWLMTLRLIDKSLADVFATLCSDLQEELSNITDELTLLDTVRDKLVSWQKLFEVTKNGLLTSNEIKGLFCELLILKELLENSPYDFRTILSSWNGPRGSDQDFQLPNMNIEVKSIGMDARRIKISSLEQLVSDKPLFLYVINLQPSGEPNALSISELVDDIEEKVANDASSLRILRTTLLAVGFVGNPSYDEPKYRLNKKIIYEVTENFPKLTKSSVGSGIDTAVYTIGIEGIGQFEVTRINYGSTQ
jgi:hypothetical protein